MKKQTFWIIAGIVLALLVILVVWQTIQISSLSSGAIETAGRVATSTAKSASLGSGMVGGC